MGSTPEKLDPISAEPSLVGSTLGKYEIVRVVGRGGMGCVYEALNTTIKKTVAIKCIDTALAQNAEAAARFQREAMAASAVDSPHIVQIFDAGETEQGSPYIVMELLRGQDLGGHITENGRLELGEALHVTAQILKGLHHAHRAGIVHRDLKPDNVFLVAREDEPLQVKLLDFGVSKFARPNEVPLQTLTRQGTVVGTPFYMSPEQAQAYPDVDGRTDLYSAGAILYECLAGKPPHVGKSYEQVIVNICMKDASDVRMHNPIVPERVAQLLHKALARERDERYASALEMLEALLEAAPESLKVSTPSSMPQLGSSAGGLRTPSGGGRVSTDSGEVPTDRIVSVPPASRPASELADTVSIGTDPSGRALPAVSGFDAPLAETQPSPDVRAAQSGTRRRWPLALAPGVALLLGTAIVFMATRRDGEPATEAAIDASDVPRGEAAATAAAKVDPSIPAVAAKPLDDPRLAQAASAAASATAAPRAHVRSPIAIASGGPGAAKLPPVAAADRNTAAPIIATAAAKPAPPPRPQLEIQEK